MNARFVITAEADPQVLPRLIEPFAMRMLLPSRVAARTRYGAPMEIEIDIGGLDEPVARRIASQMAAGVLVHEVDLAWMEQQVVASA